MPLNEFRKTSELISTDELTHVVGLKTEDGPTSVQTKEGFLSSARVDLHLGLNVVDFGATGDGVTDDTDAIQDAINASSNGHVFIPPGVYLCNLVLSDSLVISGAVDSSDIESYPVEADSWRTILKPYITNQPVIKVPDSHGVRISNLAIFGPGAYVSGSIGIKIAADLSGAKQFFSGFSTIIEGVMCIGFEAGLFAATYRLDVIQSAFRECKFNVFLNNTATAAHTPGVSNYPSDHITFINCIVSNAMQISLGVYQESPSRTNYGVYANAVRCLTFVGGDIGQCGVGIYLEGCTTSLNCHIEGTDDVGVKIVGGSTHFVAVSVLNMGGVVAEQAGSLIISGLTVNTSGLSGGIAFLGIKGELMKLHASYPLVVKYMDSDGVLIGYGMSDGQRVVMERSSNLSMTRSAHNAIVLNLKSSDCDPLEFSANGNYNTTTGRWKCVRSGMYQIEFYLGFSETITPERVYPWLIKRVAGTSVTPDRISQPQSILDAGFPLVCRFVEFCAVGATYELDIYIEGSGSLSLVRGLTPGHGVATTRMIISPVN